MLTTPNWIDLLGSASAIVGLRLAGPSSFKPRHDLLTQACDTGVSVTAGIRIAEWVVYGKTL